MRAPRFQNFFCTAIRERIKVEYSVTERIIVECSVTERIKVGCSITELIKVVCSVTERIRVECSIKVRVKRHVTHARVLPRTLRARLFTMLRILTFSTSQRKSKDQEIIFSLSKTQLIKHKKIKYKQLHDRKFKIRIDLIKKRNSPVLSLTRNAPVIELYSGNTKYHDIYYVECRFIF